MLDLVVSPSAPQPIYDQICDQVKSAIMAGALTVGDRLPSIRALASDLRVSVITVKRAYEELEAEGFIETVHGKGSFVAGGNVDALREEGRLAVQTLLEQALAQATRAGIPADEVRETLDLLTQGD